MRTVLKTLLELEGYTVIPLPPDHEIAKIVKAIQDARPDTLFLDVHLHEVNGLDVLKNLRGENSPNPMRIIMSSGMDLKDMCLAAGADDFLLKPFMPDELLAKLRG